MKTNNTYFYVNTTYEPNTKSIKDIFKQAKSDIEDIFNYNYDDYYNYNHKYNYFYDYPYYYNIFNNESNDDEITPNEEETSNDEETESEKLGNKLKLKTQKLKNLRKKTKMDEGGFFNNLFGGLGDLVSKPINAITGGASNIINSTTSGIAGILPWGNPSNYNYNTNEEETY